MCEETTSTSPAQGHNSLRMKQPLGESADAEALPPIPFRRLFTYAERAELIQLTISFLCAIIAGTIAPCSAIVFGSTVDVFTTAQNSPSEELIDSVISDIGRVTKWFLILGVISFATGFFQVRCALAFAQRLVHRLRILYFHSLLRQEFAWFDGNHGGKLSARLSDDFNLIEAGLGDKFANGMRFIITAFAGIVIAFVHGWRLTLIICTAAPFLCVQAFLFSKYVAKSTSGSQDAYASAGAIATEVFALGRTVAAYNGQEEECHRYDQKLQLAYKSAVRTGVVSGFALGFGKFVLFCTFAIAFVFGASEVRNGRMEAGDVIVSFFSVFMATASIGNAAPVFKAVTAARSAAPRIYQVIERESEIDPLDEEDGIIPDSLEGDITFESVSFNYPTRIVDEADENARPFLLQDFNMRIPRGGNHALVGFSGCGKSTIVRLIERFYDVQGGRVLIDGVDVRLLNVRWLRSRIGYVGQTPSLFMLSIRGNIALGAPMDAIFDKKVGKMVLRRRDVTDDDVVAAAKMANAHDFINKLPEKYDTMLGERGALLSGGQKQRICIARALIRNPKILLLDESTSALDAQSERHVQDALEKAVEGRTTITIAHRLSTVKNSDVISVIDKGKIVEQGGHDELVAQNGMFKTLVESQHVEADQTQKSCMGQSNSQEHDNASNVNQSTCTSKDAMLTRVGDNMINSDVDLPPTDPGVFRLALKLNTAEIPVMLLGIVGAVISGAALPLLGIAFGSAISDLSKPDNTRLIRDWCFIFVGLGAGAFIGNALEHGMLGISGGRLTRKVRSLAFRKLLHQEIGYFDRRENAVGQLTTRLSTDAMLVQGLTGDTMGTVTHEISSVVTGFSLAILSCWEVGLVVTAMLPIMALSEAVILKKSTGFAADVSTQFARAGAVAIEAVDNLDTVTSLSHQDYFINKYAELLKEPIRIARKRALSSGVSFGIALFMAQALWAVSFWVGSVFVRNERCTLEMLMRAISGLLFAGIALGQASAFMPDLAKSRVAATTMFRLLDRRPVIDLDKPDGIKRKQADIEGVISSEGIEFEYPSRPDVPVLRGLSIQAPAGQSIAIVGESGCGKSTIASLIERFYDVRAGVCSLDDEAISSYDVRNLRSHLAFVQQEADLFDRSVRDNIAYGLQHDEGTVVTDSAVENAAKMAHAHEFIIQLPQGYSTMVGPRGDKLSGGQRQRVALARSLMRAGKVLLLDEATSALDAVAERAVMESLKGVRNGGCTTISIAHRLSTVVDADIIFVVKRGRVVESGKHDELLKLNGVYTNLVHNQISATL